MATAITISEQEYRKLALTDTDHLWELWDGVLAEKPLMSMKHETVASFLGHLLQSQLDHRVFRVHVNGGRTRLSARTYYIPDVVVIPAAYMTAYEDDPRAFNAYSQPLPLVAEVWSRSTGTYDFETKLQGYRERGDREIWYVRPYERTLTAWRRQLDGTYLEALYRGGIVPVTSLPDVAIDFDTLLDE